MEPLERVSDIVEVAVRMERHATALYHRLARAAASPRARDVFSYLAAEEEKHLGAFRAILDRSAGYVARFEYPGEFELFLDGVAQRTLAGAIKENEALAAASIEEAVGVGIDLELGSIVFYGELAAQFGERERAPIDEIIRQEKGHLAKLQALLAGDPELET